ncbi:MAG TPA: sn-glycerol-3-phosphate ABC transporter ATP-binding protein UgpC [Solirubrobacteraceae bacterium]|jgi:multiple sugar transport system ATP-binding protein
MSGINLSGIVKDYGGGVRALHGIDLEIPDGKLTVLVGPSGCGKSTLLRIIAGLEEATEGTVHIGDRDVTNAAPGDRDVAMVFQNYALYPHMTVRQNMRFGLEVRKTPRREIEQRVLEAAAILGIEGYLDRKPRQLSGGQRQRVAMGRAIVRRPVAFLMDEPLSNLDAQLRVAMRAEIARLREAVATTTVYVTHDQVEAMTLGDYVVVLRDGVLQQRGTPREVFDRPANVFVATFIGSPAMNVVTGSVDSGTFRAGEQVSISLEDAVGRRFDGRRVVVGVRPTDLIEDALAPESMPRIELDCDVVEYLGTEANALFSLDVPPVEGTAISRDVDGALSRRTQFRARLPRDTSARHGAPFRLAVDPQRVYLFDADTHQTVWSPADVGAAAHAGREL